MPSRFFTKFDKSRDDRVPEAEWTPHRGPVEVVLLEGWCVGARPQQEEALTAPVNELERKEDADGAWRRYINQRLESDYTDLFQSTGFCGYCSARRISRRCIRGGRSKRRD